MSNLWAAYTQFASTELEGMRRAIVRFENRPVLCAMIRLYVAMQERVVARGPEGLTEKERQTMEKLRSKIPTLNKGSGMSRELGIEEVLGFLAKDDYPTADRNKLRKEMKKDTPRGVRRTPTSASLSILALELHLFGHTDCEIANYLCQYQEGLTQHGPNDARNCHKDPTAKEDECAARFRKRREELEDFLLNECGFELPARLRK